ncbi:MAG: hypothetical protein J5I35_00340 [Methanothrix harundinacea]|nr:hypothetical protein [Methanothrix harundinacea]
MQSVASTKEEAAVPDGLHHRRGVEFLAAARLEAIHTQYPDVQKDTPVVLDSSTTGGTAKKSRDKAAEPDSYYLSAAWKRLDEEAQRICAVTGW